MSLTLRGDSRLDRSVRRGKKKRKPHEKANSPVITPRPSFRLSSFKRLCTPLTFTDEQYPLFRNSFDTRPTVVTVAFETIDIQALGTPSSLLDRGSSELRLPSLIAP